MIHTINLPSAHPLLPSLLRVGFSHEIATVASKLYQLRADELKRRTETMLIATWEKIATLPGASTSSLDPLTGKDISNLTEIYLRCLEEWKEEMVLLLKQTPQLPPKGTPPRSSRSFNHECLPLLEHFFEENPFPTHADKVFLAKKSNMQYKQIHVWFQNRRSRTKREGKPLRKKPISEVATRPLDKLCGRTKDYVAKPVPQTNSPSQVPLSRSDDQLQIQNNVFTLPPPPHAFPSSYPPTCAYDPFPCKSGPISLEKPEWRRMSCLKPSSVSVSIDDLVTKFSQLSVRDNMRNMESHGQRTQAATAAITIIPSRAPLPSFIVQKHLESAHVTMHYPSVRAPISRSPAFQSTFPGTISQERAFYEAEHFPVTTMFPRQKGEEST